MARLPGGSVGGLCGSPWDGQPWSLSNSDNSSGSGSKPGDQRPPGSTSTSPKGRPMALVGEKRGREGPASKSSFSKGGGSKGTGGESDHEMHIWTERERRKKMRNMFSNLHALLPQLPPKADKSTIVDEAVNYIKTLQQTLQNLQKQKLERLRGALTLEEPSSSVMAIQAQGLETREAFMADVGKSLMPLCSPTAISIPRFPLCFQTWSSPNLILSVTGDDAHINICTAKKPGLLSTIFYVLEKHKLEVVSAHVSSDYFRSVCMIHARASGVSDRFPESLIVEEMFKLAVGELILWLSS